MTFQIPALFKEVKVLHEPCLKILDKLLNHRQGLSEVVRRQIALWSRSLEDLVWREEQSFYEVYLGTLYFSARFDCKDLMPPPPQGPLLSGPYWTSIQRIDALLRLCRGVETGGARGTSPPDFCSAVSKKNLKIY